jgi:hypothetical protein
MEGAQVKYIWCGLVLMLAAVAALAGSAAKTIALLVAAAGVPVALTAAAWVGWLLWQVRHDRYPGPVRQEAAPERVRAEVKVIRVKPLPPGEGTRRKSGG